MAQGKHYHSQTLYLCVWCKALFRSPIPFSFVDCSILFSLELVPLPVISSPPQVSYGSGISNILGSPRQSRLQLCSGLSGPPCRTPWPQQLSLATEGDSIAPLLYSWLWSRRLVAEAAKLCCLGDVCISFLWWMVSVITAWAFIPFLRWMLTWVGSCPEVSTVFILFSTRLFFKLFIAEHWTWLHYSPSCSFSLQTVLVFLFVQLGPFPL